MLAWGLDPQLSRAWSSTYVLFRL